MNALLRIVITLQSIWKSAFMKLLEESPSNGSGSSQASTSSRIAATSGARLSCRETGGTRKLTDSTMRTVGRSSSPSARSYASSRLPALTMPVSGWM
jgi:hypothetical protein